MIYIVVIGLVMAVLLAVTILKAVQIRNHTLPAGPSSHRPAERP